MSINKQELIEENISIDTEIGKDKDIFKSTLVSENPIVLQLIEFGYDSIYSRRLFYYLHPEDLEEALNYMEIENGIIQHRFIHNNKDILNENCYICGAKKENHLRELSISRNQEQNNFNTNINIDINISDKSNTDKNTEKKDGINNINNNEILNEVSSCYLKTDENKLIKEDYNIRNNNNNVNNNIDNEREEAINECPVCGEKFSVNKFNKVQECGHSFCGECWYNFLSIKIIENKLPSIKCLDYNCDVKLIDEFIFNIINSDFNLIKKYKQYKLELDIMKDPNKKLCPYPNCDSYLELKDIKNKYVTCLKQHKYCFLCLKKPHGNSPCEKNIDIDLKEYAQNYFVKKCPYCGIIIEKQSGCNHITCSKCGYQWCWLCNNEYSQNHFKEGKCKGLQFYQPKNDYEVKLVLEGKINYNELSENQRQYNTNRIEDLNDIHNIQQNQNVLNNEEIRNNIFTDRIDAQYVTVVHNNHPPAHDIEKTNCDVIIFLFFYLIFGHGILIPYFLNSQIISKKMYIIICFYLNIALFFQIIFINIIMFIPISIGFCFRFKEFVNSYNIYSQRVILIIINILLRQFFLVYNIWKKIKYRYPYNINLFQKLLIFIPSFITSFLIIFPQCILSNIFILIIMLIIYRRNLNDLMNDLDEELDLDF